MQNYNFIQRQLHKIILNSNLIKKSIFEIEKNLFFKNDPDLKNLNHIFISSLPRSGTTMILDYIYQTNEFASITYEDMPFVLSPNLFKKIYPKRKIFKKERMHKDGVYFDLQSPEAFDEIFFKTFNEKEIKENLLIFIYLVLKKYKKKKYLSKNNNNFNRIKIIQSILPSSKIIITFRDPIQHAQSLLEQHINFCELQKNDEFILQYMNFLGHNEFGLNHISWNDPVEFSDKFSLNYWLEQWLLYYKNVIMILKPDSNIIFIDYEKFCTKQLNFENLNKKLNLKSEKINFVFKLSKKKIKYKYDSNLLKNCIEIKSNLLNFL